MRRALRAATQPALRTVPRGGVRQEQHHHSLVRKQGATDQGGRGMSTAIQARFNARWNARYRWARDHGEKYTIAKILAGNIAGFREFVRAQGIDPDTLGDFARKLQPRSKIGRASCR